VWCGVTGDELTEPFISLQRLTGDIYAKVLQRELPALLESVPLRTRRQMFYSVMHHPRFSRIVTHYLNQHFRNRWIGRRYARNWPPRSPDLNPLDSRLCGVT
jgi:hypothetical protein